VKTYPRISIITPSYNQGTYLEKTIRSILDQEYPNLEYIIIDGGSTDDSVEIIERYHQKLTYWISEPDNGQSEAINKGISKATGDIINWINSDDYMEPDSLFQIAQAFSDPDLQVCCGFAKVHWPDKKFLKRTARPEPDFARFIAQGHLMQPATFWRKSIFDEVTPLDKSFHYLMDHHIWVKYFMKYRMNQVHFSDELWVHVAMHEEAKSVKSRAGFDQEKDRIIQGVLSAIAPDPVENGLGFASNPEFKKYESGIRFYYKYDTLFERNPYGERGKINLSVLTELFLRYPVRFLTEIARKISRKSNWEDSIKELGKSN